MKLIGLIKNKKFLFLIVLLNFLGVVLSLYTYIDDISFYIAINKFYVIPFFIVSFWLYFLAFLLTLFVYLDKDVPEFFGSLAFVYCFVYGIGSFLFYPLFMLFVDGISIYHSWNIIAHGFVGAQAILFFPIIRRPRIHNYVFLFSLFIIKDFMDLFSEGFLYFVKFDFSFYLKLFLIFVILGLQILAFYFLLTKNPKRLK